MDDAPIVIEVGAGEDRLPPVQRARIVDEQGEELADGIARLALESPASAVIVDLEPAAPLARELARGGRDFRLELEVGLCLPVRILGTFRSAGRRRVCFLRILSAPLPCYAIDVADRIE